MNTFEKITKARQLLEIPEKATMEEIKDNYRKLILQWHPDKCQENREQATEMSAKITEAYKTILTYCNNYKLSFSEDEVRKYIPKEEWWMDRFGNDPVWNKGRF